MHRAADVPPTGSIDRMRIERPRQRPATPTGTPYGRPVAPDSRASGNEGGASIGGGARRRAIVRGR